MNGNQPSKLKDLLTTMRTDFFDFVEATQFKARLERAKYEALIESGFTKEEALEIIKARGTE